MEEFPPFHPARTGEEPLHARTPLLLRLIVAFCGLAAAIAGIVVFAVADVISLVAVFAAFVVLAVVDVAVVLRHINAGIRFQPRPGSPPSHLPDVEAERPPEPHVPTAHHRHALYIWAAVASLVLVVNAWAWVYRISVGAATVLSIVAGFLLLAGIVESNTGSSVLRGNSVPGTGDEREEYVATEQATAAAEVEAGAGAEGTAAPARVRTRRRR